MIVVTGASRGLGKAITERLTKIGHKVIGLARSNSRLGIEIIKCDVTEYESVKNAALEIKKRKTPIKAFINAAGIVSTNMALSTNELTIQKLIQTNLVGTIYCCQLFAPMMLRRKKGRIRNYWIAQLLLYFCKSFYISNDISHTCIWRPGIEGKMRRNQRF